MTRMEEVIAAVTQTLRRWAREVDRGDDIRAVTVSVKLAPGALRPRAVVCQVESEKKLLPAGRQS
ncbi:MAG: hypothetical protein HY047_16145 [Acidobacteria bacterium]|nr:hypothetical protein [Acidobacteriota bacterium]